MTFNLHTRKHAEIDSDAAVVRGDTCYLRIVPINWEPTKSTAAVDGIDEHLDEVTAIRFSTAKASTHRLITAVEIYPENGDVGWSYSVAGGHVEAKRQEGKLSLDASHAGALEFRWKSGTGLVSKSL
jgi:hypothetical protein